MKKAVVIGINNYPFAQLKGCINDANSVAAILKTNEDGSPNFDVKIETNVQTKAELKKMIANLFSLSYLSTLPQTVSYHFPAILPARLRSIHDL